MIMRRLKILAILLAVITSLGELSAQDNATSTVQIDDGQQISYEVVTTSKYRPRVPATYPNEISFSVGVLSAPQMVNSFITLLSLGQAMPMYYAPICLNLGYSHRLSHIVDVGAIFSYEYAMRESSDDVLATEGMNHISLIPAVKLYWFNYEKVAMYSHLGLGVTLRHGITDGTRVSGLWPAYQLSAVCVEAGGEKLRFFLETGVGSTTGLLSVGLKARF